MKEGRIFPARRLPAPLCLEAAAALIERLAQAQQKLGLRKLCRLGLRALGFGNRGRFRNTGPISNVMATLGSDKSVKLLRGTC